MNIRKVKKGFSLIELMLTLSIIAILSVVAFFTFNHLNNDHKTNEEISNLKIIKSSLDNISSNSFDKIEFTKDMLNSIELKTNENGELFDEWKNKILLSKTGTNDLYYNIGYSKINKDSCIGMISNVKSVFNGVKVNGNIVGDRSISNLSNQCEDGNVNQIEFTNSALNNTQENSNNNDSGENNNNAENGNTNTGNSGNPTNNDSSNSENNEKEIEDKTDNSTTDKGKSEEIGNTPQNESQLTKTLTNEEKKIQKELIENAPWATENIGKTTINADGTLSVALKDYSNAPTDGSVTISDVGFAGLLNNVLSSNHGTVSTGDIQNYIMSFADDSNKRNIMDGQSITFTDTAVPKNMCMYASGFNCRVEQTGSNTYTTKVTFSKAEKESGVYVSWDQKEIK